ncbi:MAG: zinc-ribbon domain-containing protein [Desulfobacterales bacterium]|nr:zinc-ribbon domain-containing protein [Desulfobacterales bacterium]
MDIQCDACKTVYKIQDGVIPAGKKVRFTCKRCRSAGGDAPAPRPRSCRKLRLRRSRPLLRGCRRGSGS